MPQDISITLLGGHLGADPELRYVGSGNSPLCKARLATSEGEGEKKRTDWHLLVAWGSVAEALAACSKGDYVRLEGKNETRSYDKDGEKRYVTEVKVKGIIEHVQAKKDKAPGGPPPDDGSAPF